MPEYDNNSRPIRHRPRKRKPKWQRILHKYSPTIRFGLICLVLLVALFMGIRGLVTMVVTAVENFEFPTAPPIETTEPPPPTLSPEEWQALAEETGETAKKMTLGYDYRGATELIESFEKYQEYDFLTNAITEYQQQDSQLISYPDIDKISSIL